MLLLGFHCFLTQEQNSPERATFFQWWTFWKSINAKKPQLPPIMKWPSYLGVNIWIAKSSFNSTVPHLWCPPAVVLWKSPLLPLTSSSVHPLLYYLKNQSIITPGAIYSVIHVITQHSLPWITFRTSLDVRFPITIRSKGNWSVLYVRMVCVTTLPKCLVHMVSNLKENIKYISNPEVTDEMNQYKVSLRMDFRIKWKKICRNQTITCGCIYSSCSHETDRQLMNLRTLTTTQLFPISDVLLR